MSTNYLALTIGPIVETLIESKRTKELFAGSYIFSYFMKELLKKLKAKNYQLIVPHVDDKSDMLEAKNGIGKFHDRLIVSNALSKEQIKEDVDISIKEIISNITAHIISMEPYNKRYQDKIEEFFTNYFQISYYITDSFSLKEITSVLDSFELHREFIISPTKYNILKDQEGKNVNPLVYLQRKFHKSFLKDDAFNKNTLKGFPSLLEIALDKTIDYSYEDEQKDAQLEKEAIKGTKIHKKYVALIQADGDKIGAIINKIDKNPQDIQKFSQKLLEFTSKLPDIAKKHRAKIVYAGGDDILAFAPILSDDTNLFDFLKELDDVFKATLKELDIKEAKSVSLSFGVSLVYYKKPLYQALQKATENLFGVAKSSKDRNKAVIELIKHSGQTHKVDLKLNSRIYDIFSKLLTNELGDKSSGLPHAITHNLERSLGTLKAISDQEHSTSDTKSMLDNFFENNFNKTIHQNEATKHSLELAKELLLEHIYLYKVDKDAREFRNYFESFSSMIGMIKHLRGDR